MNPRDSLHLYEEILLLALRDRQGTVVSGAWYAQAIAGAVLAELLLSGRIRAVGKRSELELASAASLGDPLLDECLALLADSGKTKPMRFWLAKVANWKGLKHRVAEGLCRKDVLRGETERVLLFFERRVYPEVNPEPERVVIERLRSAIFDEGKDVDPRTVVLLSLAYRTNVLKAVFERADLKRRKPHIERLIDGEATGQAAKHVLDELQAALIVTTIIT